MCEDSARFTETCASLPVTTVAQKLLSLCAFLHVLYSISPALAAVSFLYGFAGALVASKTFAGRLTDADTKCAKTNADLRCLLLRVRDKAESVGERLPRRRARVEVEVESATRTKIAASRDWTAALSPGQRQRVAFARLALRCPSLAFLDEATSFLDETAECEIVFEKKRAGCVVSVGHRSSLRKFHDAKIEFIPAPTNAPENGGTWETRFAAYESRGVVTRGGRF